MVKFTYVLLVGLLVGIIGCWDTVTTPLLHNRTWEIADKNCPSSSTTVHEQLDRWAWQEDGTTFIKLYKRLTVSGVPCDAWEWDVVNIARDRNTSKVQLLAEIRNPEDVVFREIQQSAICHVYRDENALWIIQNFDISGGGDTEWAKSIGFPKRTYTITNPLMEKLDWQNQRVETTLRRIPQPKNYGFGQGFQLYADGQWTWIDMSVDLMFKRSLQDAGLLVNNPPTIDYNGARWHVGQTIAEFPCTLRYTDEPYRKSEFVKIRKYSVQFKSGTRLW